MSEQEENKTTEEANTDESVVEVEWVDVEELFNIRASLLEVESTLSTMMLNFEKKKAAFLHRARELETALYSSGSALRDKKQIDQSVSYELKLPPAKGEKAYFIRKDD